MDSVLQEVFAESFIWWGHHRVLQGCINLFEFFISFCAKFATLELQKKHSIILLEVAKGSYNLVCWCFLIDQIKLLLVGNPLCVERNIHLLLYLEAVERLMVAVHDAFIGANNVINM